MGQLLTVYTTIFAYSDGSETNNPRLQDFSYQRQIPDQPTSKTRSQQYIVSPSETETALNVQRPIISGTSWSINAVADTLYAQASWTGMVNPILRTERTGSTLANADIYSITRQSSSKVVRVDFGSKSVGTGLLVGDEIYFGPGSGLVDSDQGVYSIVGSTSHTVDIIAPSLGDQAGMIIVSASDIYAFSSGPVRVNDFVKVGSAFSFGNRGEFKVTQVTSRFVQFHNSDLIIEGPITQDITFYDQLYKTMFLESDQTINVYINGSSTPITIEPYCPGQNGLIGYLLMRSPVFLISIENLGNADAHVTTFFAT